MQDVLSVEMSVTTRKPSSTPPITRLIPKAVRQPLQAVVVDANAYGPVGPDILALAELARDLAAIGIQTWIPEPVAWEWAEHLAAQWTAAVNTVMTPSRQLRRAGLPPLFVRPSYRDRDEVIAAFLTRIEGVPHTEVVSLTGESARQGLKDQVLQRSPAKTKSDQKVKTGGSDSAWLRDVIAKAGGAADELLFLSADADIKRAYEQWGHPPPLMRTVNEIRASLFEDVPATEEDTWLVVRYLVARMPHDLQSTTPAADGTVADEPLIGNTPGLAAVLDPDPDHDTLLAANLTRLTALAGVTSVTRKQPEIDEVDDGEVVGGLVTRTLRCTAFFLAEAEASMNYIDGDGQVSPGTATRQGLLVRTRLAFEVHDQTVTRARSDGDAVVFLSSTFADNGDALEELGEALTTVPGLKLPPDWGDWKDGVEQEIQIAGRDEIIELHWTHHDFGGLTLLLGDDEVSLTCEYDQTKWVGGKDGFEIEPPYYLDAEYFTADSDLYVTADTIWSIPAWIITQLIQTDNQV